MKKSFLKQLIREAVEEIQDTMADTVNEDQLEETFTPEKDEIGSFFITIMPTNTSKVEDSVVECSSIIDFANQIQSGLQKDDVKGIYKTEAKAKKLAEKLISERDKKRTEVKTAADAYKKMKEETLAKVSEYMKNKKVTKAVVDELDQVTKD